MRDAFLSLWLPAGASGLATGMIAPVLPALAKSFEVTVGVASLVFIVHMAGSAIGTLPTGFMIDRFGRRKVLIAGPIITALAAFAIVWAGSFTEILVYRFIGGWGQQMWALSRLTVIADSAGTTRGRQVTSMFGAQRVGTLLGPVVGGIAAETWGLDVPFMVMGIVLLAGVLPSALVIRDAPRKRHVEGGKPEPSLNWRSFLVAPIPAVFSAQFLINVARGGVENGGVMFLYGAYAYDAGPATLGILSSIMAGASIPIALIAGVVMDTRGRKHVIIPGTASLTVALVLMAVTSFADLPFSAFVGGFILTHFAVSIMLGAWQTLSTDVAPAYGRGTFFGASRLVSHSGRLASPSAFALVYELLGYGAAFVFLAGGAVASGAVVLFLFKETLGRDADTDEQRKPAGR